VLNRRPQVADLLRPRSWLRFKTGRLLSTLGLVAVSSEVVDAARKDDRRGDNQGRNSDDAESNRDARHEKNQTERGSDRESDRKASEEDQDTGGKSGKSAENDQDKSRGENDDKSNHDGSDSGKSGGDSQRQNAGSKSNSSESSAEENDSHQHGGRHVRDFEQRADAPADDVPNATDATPANPNDVIDTVPSTSINDLVVNANDDVIASVSTSGGFAFARSGGVTAVTGPDGASIIQTGDVTTGTRGTTPTEPSDDGGNNNLDFSS
jgi:hypothetical protein